MIAGSKPASVTIDEPMVEHAGGAVAAPVFRRVAQAALELRGLVRRTAGQRYVRS